MNPDCTPESLLESHLAAIHNMLRKNITKIPDHEIIDWSLKTAYEICHTRNTDATFFLELHTGLNRWLCDFGYLFPKVASAVPSSGLVPPLPLHLPLSYSELVTLVRKSIDSNSQQGHHFTSIERGGTNVEVIDAVIQTFENYGYLINRLSGTRFIIYTKNR